MPVEKPGKSRKFGDPTGAARPAQSPPPNPVPVSPPAQPTRNPQPQQPPNVGGGVAHGTPQAPAARPARAAQGSPPRRAVTKGYTCSNCGNRVPARQRCGVCRSWYGYYPFEVWALVLLVLALLGGPLGGAYVTWQRNYDPLSSFERSVRSTRPAYEIRYLLPQQLEGRGASLLMVACASDDLTSTEQMHSMADTMAQAVPVIQDQVDDISIELMDCQTENILSGYHIDVQQAVTYTETQDWGAYETSWIAYSYE